MPPHETTTRHGDAPLVSTGTPHQQLTQAAPFHLQEELYRRCCRMLDAEAHPSLVSVPGARALSVRAPVLRPDGRFMARREFFHLHPSYDGSMHVCLPLSSARRAMANGWADFHPLAGKLLPRGTVLFYGPRDEVELETCWSVVQQAFAHARGDLDDD